MKIPVTLQRTLQALFITGISIFALAVAFAEDSTPVAQAEKAERIAITNVQLIGRDAPSQDVAVNLLIVDGKLVVVTKDKLVIEPGDTAVDASGGFLLGTLTLGQSPGFVILDRDPRQDDVLLDTRAHVRFAIRDGAIVNPLDKKMMANIIAATALAGKDDFCMQYLHAFRENRLDV